MKSRTPVLFFALTCVFFSIGLLSRSELDRLREKRLVSIPDCPLCEIEYWEAESLYIPTGKMLPHISLGHAQLLADLVWLKTVIYFGQHHLTDKNYPYLFHLLDIVTDLDPRYKEPYLFGGIVLSVEVGAIEESNLLLHKGMVNFPLDWRFPFYIGFNYWFFQNDHVQAAEYISLSSELPGAPPYLPRLVATLYIKGGQREVAMSFLRELSHQTQDERILDQIRRKMERIIRERK